MIPAGKEIKVSLYADDNTVFVRDLYSIAHLLSLLDWFKNRLKRLKECGPVAGKTTLKRRLASAGHVTQ